MKLKYGFNIGDKVYIHEATIYGYIQQILMSCDGIQYQVRYWDGTTRKTEWLFIDEICKADQTKNVNN